jgi:hypothetical protein
MFWVLTRASIDQRLEDARVNEQAADVARQEKLLKLVSNELTKNTTRVVEMAVKAEVQNSVLPSLENITKVEVRTALNGQIAKGLGESMNQVFLSGVSTFSVILTISVVLRLFLTRLKSCSFDQTSRATLHGRSQQRLPQSLNVT